MKKKITLLFISFFLLASCSSDEDSSATPVAPVTPLTIKAALNGGGVDVSWSVVGGTGITYNVYRNDNPVKINATPLTEAKFKDVLTSTGSFTYTVTANSGGMESAKGVVSEKVILELPKTRTVESISNAYNTKTEYTFTYDTSNITKLVSITIKSTMIKLSDQTVTEGIRTIMYTYNGDLITKVNNYKAATPSTEYVYNEGNKEIAMISTKSDGSIDYSVNFAHNEDGTITETSDLSGWGTWVYAYEKGNTVKYTYSVLKYGSTNYVETCNSIFDTKNSYSKNILGFNNLITEGGGVNNQISSSIIGTNDGRVVTTRSYKSEYTYNENGYILTKMKYIMTLSVPVLTEKTVITYY